MNFCLIALPAAAVSGVAAAHWLHRAEQRRLTSVASTLQSEIDTLKTATPALPDAERPEMLQQLSNCLSLRSGEDQVLWAAFGTFWAANAVLLVALFATGKPPESPVVGPIVAFVGMVVSLVWHWIQQRALGHVMRYEALAARLEKRLGTDPALSVSASRNDADYQLYLPGRLKARQLMQWCSGGVALLWATAFLFFLGVGVVGVQRFCSASRLALGAQP